MKKWTIEDEMRFMPFIEEGERDIEENGLLSEEEFWALLEEEERRDGIYTKRNKNTIKLHLARCIGKISRRFIRA